MHEVANEAQEVGDPTQATAGLLELQGTGQLCLMFDPLKKGVTEANSGAENTNLNEDNDIQDPAQERLGVVNACNGGKQWLLKECHHGTRTQVFKMNQSFA